MAEKKTSKSSSGKSSAKTNAKRVVKAAGKYDTNKSVLENSDAIKGVVTATATSAARSSNKKQKKLYVALLIILIVAIVGVLIFGYYQGWFDGILHPQTEDPNGGSGGGSSGGAVIGSVADMSIHFMELGNGNSGDSIYIKAGDTDILIDAGSRAGSASAITSYVDQYCKDGKLEYVIATHADQDHIAGFVGTNAAKGIFDYYECETIIQFAATSKVGSKETQVYKNYCAKRDAEQAAGANVYTALDCVKEENGAQKVYNLAEGITMEVLYQKYYETATSNENDHSVCLLFTQGENHYLFLGDLEEDGEASLVEENPNLPQVELYKAGHHGSKTSANEVLLEVIKPQYVCICCSAGSVEYLTTGTQNLHNTFPTQDFINRIAPYTDKVYATTQCNVKWDETKNKYVDDGYQSMNGNITFSCINGVIEVHGSNNDTILKDTAWFKTNRECPEAWK